MKHADHHGFPILTFIDTPGADPSLVSEEKGQVLCSLEFVTFQDRIYVLTR